MEKWRSGGVKKERKNNGKYKTEVKYLPAGIFFSRQLQRGKRLLGSSREETAAKGRSPGKTDHLRTTARLGNLIGMLWGLLSR